VLLEGFWSTINWRVNHSQLTKPNSPIPTNKEDITLEPFCGPKNMKPTMKITPYTPFRDLHNEDFILTCPSNLRFILYVWVE
jgi:hypothetical protein